MRKQLTIFSLLALLFAFTPHHQSYAQADCGGVTPAGGALSCTKSSGDATLTITDGSPTEVTDATAITVNATAAGADAVFSATGSVIKTTATGGSTIDVGGARGATLLLDGSARADKDGRRGTVAVVKAGTGDAVVGIHNGSVVNIDGVGTGNGIYVSSQSGKAVAEFSGKGRIEVYPLPPAADILPIPIYEHSTIRDGVQVPYNILTGTVIEVEKVEIYDYDFRVAGETKGIEMETQAGNIELSFSGIYSGIETYVPGMQDLASDTKAATVTSVSGDITVNVTDQAAIFASSVGDSYGLAAVTGGAGSIEINLLNGVASIVGRNGIIANTVNGDIDITLSKAVIEGRGRGQLDSAYTEAYGISVSTADQAGIGVDATSTDGDINITGDTGSAIYASGRGGVAINARTAGTLTIAFDETGGIWTTADEASTVRATGRVAVSGGAKVWANGADSNAITTTGRVDISGKARVWTQGATGTAVRGIGRVVVSGDSQVIANGGGIAVDLSQDTTGTKTFEMRDSAEVSGRSGGRGLLINPSKGKIVVNLDGSSVLSANGDGGIAALVDNRRSTAGEIWFNVKGFAKVTGDGAGTDGLDIYSKARARLDIQGSSQVYTLGSGYAARVRGAGTSTNWVNARIFGSSRVFTNGGGTGLLMDSGGTTVQLITLTDSAKVWANGADGSGVRINSHSGTVRLKIFDNVEVFSVGERSAAVNFTSGTQGTLEMHIGRGTGDSPQIHSNGIRSAAISVEGASKRPSITINGHSKVYSYGNSSTAIRANSGFNPSNPTGSGGSQGTSLDIKDDAEIFSVGDDSYAIKASGLTLDPRFANGVYANVRDRATVRANGSRSVAFRAMALQSDSIITISGEANIGVTERDSAAIFASSEAGPFSRHNLGFGDISVRVLGSAQVFAHGDSSIALRIQTKEALASAIAEGTSKIWTNGVDSATVRMQSGARRPAIFVVESGAEVWSDGDRSKTVFANTDVNKAIVHANGTIFANGDGSKVIETVSLRQNSEISLGGPGNSIFANGVGSTVVDAVSRDNHAVINAAWSNGSAIDAGGIKREITADGMGGIGLNARVTGGGQSIIYVREGAAVRAGGAGGRAIIATTASGHAQVYMRPFSAAHTVAADADTISVSTTTGAVTVDVSAGSVVNATAGNAVKIVAGSTGGVIKIVTHAAGTTAGGTALDAGSITGILQTSARAETFENNGSFIGSGNMGDGDDAVNNRGTFTLTGDFDMGAGDDTFVNLDGGTVAGDDTHTITPTPTTSVSAGSGAQSSPSRHSVPDTESSITPSASGDSRFRLSSAAPEREPERATIN
ncbi:MAG: beta strand repeat-containing protein, partial [Thermodesulfobacteriota bacterium]